MDEAGATPNGSKLAAWGNWLDSKSSWWGAWYFKSFCCGFKTILVVCFTLGICLCAEGQFWYVYFTKTGFDFNNSELVLPLFSALPALVGTTLLDYFVDQPRPRSVAWVALLVSVILLLFAWVALSKSNLISLYVITFCVLLLAWCIKGKDKRYENDFETEGRDVSAAAGGDPSKTSLNGAGISHGLKT